MDGGLSLIRTNCDKAGDYVVPNVLSPRDLVSHHHRLLNVLDNYPK